MTRTELYCDACGQKVRDTNGVIFAPFLGYKVAVVNTASEVTLESPSATDRHICKTCLACFAELYNRAKTTGYEGARPA